MRLINADDLEELFREVIGGIAKKPEMTRDLEHMVRASAMVIEMIKDAQEIDAIPIGCLELEKRDCGFADQCDMGSSYHRERERSCKNIIEWWKSPSYERCLEVATQRKFVEKRWKS